MTQILMSIPYMHQYYKERLGSDEAAQKKVLDVLESAMVGEEEFEEDDIRYKNTCENLVATWFRASKYHKEQIVNE